MEKELDILFDKGTLMDLYIGRWAGIKKMRPHELLLDQIDEEAFYLGHKKLLPKEAMEKLVTLEGKARTALSKRSIDFPVGGARFVYYKALPEVIALLNELKKEWETAVEDLVQEYPALKEKQLTLLDKQIDVIAKEELKKAENQEEHETLYEKLESWKVEQKAVNRQLYPTADVLKTKFPFDWRMFKISALQGIEQMSTLQAEDLLAAQNKLREDLQKWVKEAATAMHLALGEAAARAKDMLEKQGKLNPKNLKPLFEAFETFKAIDFTGQSNFQTVIDDIKSKYGVKKNEKIDYELTAGSLNYDDQAKKELSSLLSSLGKLAAEDAAELAGLEAIGKVGEFKRFVDLG
jgi:hypothetical protein